MLREKAIWSRENLPVFSDDLSKGQVKEGRREKKNSMASNVSEDF